MANEYSVISTQPYTYLDETGQVIDGFKVFFNIAEFDETHFVLVRSLAPAVVTKVVKGLVADRKTISTQ